MRLGMQIAFGQVRRKTASTGPGMKTRPKNGELNDSAVSGKRFDKHSQRHYNCEQGLFARRRYEITCKFT